MKRDDLSVAGRGENQGHVRADTSQGLQRWVTASGLQES